MSISYLRDMPSYQDEKNTYASWSETIQSTAELGNNPVYGPYTWTQPTAYSISGTEDLHDSTECDKLWTHLHQWRRTRRQFYKRRMVALADYFINDWLTDTEFDVGGTGDVNFGHDHLWGMGLVDYYKLTGDTAALDAAKAGLTLVKTRLDDGSFIGSFGWGPTGGGTNNLFCQWGGRQFSRQFLLATLIADEDPTYSDAVTMRNNHAQDWVDSQDWFEVQGTPVIAGRSNGGFYVYHDLTENSGEFPGSWTTKSNLLISPFHYGWIAESFWRYIMSVGLDSNSVAIALKQRLIDMGNWVLAFGLDDIGQVTKGHCGLTNTTVSGNVVTAFTKYHQQSVPLSGTNPWETHSFCNLLVMCYKLTGDNAFYNGAKTHFLRLNGSQNPGHPINDRNQTIHHMVDTLTNSGEVHREMLYNRAELFYTFMLFENGGSPTVLS